MNPIIRFQNVIKRFGALTVLDNFNFEVQRGEKVTLIGPSGSGKSTVLRILMTLEPFQEGLLEIDGISYHEPDGRGPFKASEKHLHTIRSNVGMVFQSFNLFPHMTVLRNVVEAPVAVLKMKREEAESRATELLRMVGLYDKKDHFPSQLSGGQQQRVAIARALVHDPPLVLADEPTAHLDHIQVEGVLQLLRELASPGRVVIVSTHDDRVTHLADRVIELVPNLASADRPPEELECQPGELVFEQGSRGDLVYVVEEG
ncbi:MAG: amino acid ABC transporter ATP-binding protein, partial [Microvirga sp.]